MMESARGWGSQGAAGLACTEKSKSILQEAMSWVGPTRQGRDTSTPSYLREKRSLVFETTTWQRPRSVRRVGRNRLECRYDRGESRGAARGRLERTPPSDPRPFIDPTLSRQTQDKTGARALGCEPWNRVNLGSRARGGEQGMTSQHHRRPCGPNAHPPKEPQKKEEEEEEESELARSPRSWFSLSHQASHDISHSPHSPPLPLQNAEGCHG
jgi:hypothetical protein